MLTGKQVRVKVTRDKLVPHYLPVNAGWLSSAEQLLAVFRDCVGRTRGEIEEQLADFVADGPNQLVHQGFAKLLEDRCEFEVASEFPPDTIRDAVFRLAAIERGQAAKDNRDFDRAAVMNAASLELALSPEQIDIGLFADLKDEQRVLSFDDISPERFIHRYNVALAQAIVLRSTGVDIRVWNETPARFRQLFRAIKFRRLICDIRPTDDRGYMLKLDGPLSLFSSTQKYGLQLALFLPTLLHCSAFDLRARVLWGPKKQEKLFVLTGSDGLRSHTADFGVHTPREVEMFVANFQSSVPDWVLSDDPTPLSVGGTTWVPDFTLTHTPSGKVVYLEIVGFWRKVDVEATYKKLRSALPGQFVLAVSEQYCADESASGQLGADVYYYKRTPSATEVARTAASVAGV